MGLSSTDNFFHSIEQHITLKIDKIVFFAHFKNAEVHVNIRKIDAAGKHGIFDTS